MNYRIIAVDFDGTLCYSNWPELGEPNMPLIEYLRAQKKSGNKLILWTCRAGEALENAVSWCRELHLQQNCNSPKKDFSKTIKSPADRPRSFYQLKIRNLIVIPDMLDETDNKTGRRNHSRSFGALCFYLSITSRICKAM